MNSHRTRISPIKPFRPIGKSTYFHVRIFEYYHSFADLARIHGADKMRAFRHAFVQTNDLLDFEESGDAVDASSCFCAIRRIGLGPAQFANATCGTKAAMASACPWQPEWAPGSRLDLSPGTIQRVRKLRRRQINPRLRPLRQSLSPKIPPPLGSGCRLRNEG